MAKAKRWGTGRIGQEKVDSRGRCVAGGGYRRPFGRPALLLALVGLGALLLLGACEGKSTGEPPAALNPGPPIRKAFIVSLQAVGEGIDQYQAENGQVPQGEGVQVLIRAGIRSAPEHDPWGGEVRYEGSGNSYTLSSAGPDQRWGTPDDVVYKNGHLVLKLP